MANIRASAAATTLLVAAVSAVSIGIAAAGGVTATAQPNTVIRASAFVVPTSTLENQTVQMSDFRAFFIEQISIDVATATDDVAISFDTSFTDSVTMTDAVNRMFYGNIDFDPLDPDADPDPIVMADVNAKNVGKTLTDAATATDSPAKTPGKVVTDSVTSADVITTKDVGKALTDTATTNDTINTFNTDKVLVDSATATDAAAKDFTRPNVTDSVTTADDSSRQPGLGKTETVTASDAFGPFNIGVNPSDTATATDAVNTFAVNKVLTDSVEMTDFIAKTPGYAFDFDVVDADADPDPVTTTDVMAKEFTRPNITDTATIADSPVFTVGDVQTDSVTMADAAAFTVGDVQTDSVTATDATALNFGDVQTDSVTASDVVTTKALNKTLTGADTATMADVITTFALNKTLTDAATMADVINLILTLGQSTPLYDWAFTSDDKFTYFQVPGTINSHLIHQPLINGEFVLTTDPNAGIVYTIRTESYSYMFAGYGLNENQLN
jgi:hypothetical protein